MLVIRTLGEYDKPQASCRVRNCLPQRLVSVDTSGGQVGIRYPSPTMDVPGTAHRGYSFYSLDQTTSVRTPCLPFGIRPGRQEDYRLGQQRRFHVDAEVLVNNKPGPGVIA